jgi:DNA-binding transcriptional MerR regulator
MKSIGEVATRFGLPTHVLRHWEAEGLLTPARVGGRRRYTDADLYRVAAILVSKEAGFGVADIRRVLSATSAPARREVMARHRETLLARIARAKAALEMFEGGLECAHDDIMTCPHFQKLLTERLQLSFMTGSDHRNADRAFEFADRVVDRTSEFGTVVGRAPDHVASNVDQEEVGD